MFLHISFILTLIADPVHPSPFMDQMLHRRDQKILISQDSNRYADNLQYTH